MSEKKGKPGRPRTKPIVSKNVIRGIVDKPDFEENCLEFSCDTPGVFRGLVNYFNNCKASQIILQCLPTRFAFFAQSQSIVSRTLAEIDVKHVTRYYSAGENVFKINLVEVSKHFKSIDASTNTIEFILATGSDRLHIVLIDSLQKKRTSITVNIKPYDQTQLLIDTEPIIANLLTNFHLKFEQTAKQFKKTITDLSNQGQVIILEKRPDECLRFSSKTINSEYNVEYEDPVSIKFKQSDEIADTCFSVQLQVEYIKDFASAILSDLTLFVRSDCDILFRSIAIDEEQPSPDEQNIATINTLMQQYKTKL